MKVIPILVAVSFISGCSSIKVSDYIENWSDIPTDITLNCTPAPTTGSSSGDVGESSESATSSQYGSPLQLSAWAAPAPLQNNAAVNAMDLVFDVKSSSDSGESSDGGKRSLRLTRSTQEIEISLGDIKDFSGDLADSLPSNIFAVDSTSIDEGESSEGSGGNIFKDYYLQYANQGFVSRDGVEFNKLEFSKTFGADKFGAITHIFVEAAADKKLSTPVLYHEKDGDKLYLPAEKEKKPTSLVLNAVNPVSEVKEVKLLSKDQSEYCGITEAEYRIMQAAATASSESVGLAASAAIEALSDIELSFIIGADISIGDADTVPTMAKTFIEKTVAFAQQAKLYDFFYHFSYKRLGDLGESSESTSTGSLKAVGIERGIDVGESSEAATPPQFSSLLEFIEQQEAFLN